MQVTSERQGSNLQMTREVTDGLLTKWKKLQSVTVCERSCRHTHHQHGISNESRRGLLKSMSCQKMKIRKPALAPQK